MQNCARMAFELARGFDQMSVVVDADGLWLVQVGQTQFSVLSRDTGLMMQRLTRRSYLIGLESPGSS